MSKKITCSPELTEEFHPTMNGDLKPHNLTVGSNRKVWWLGKKCGHSWESRVGNRFANKTGCPYCNGRKADESNNLEKLRPDLISEWDWNKNGDLKPHNLTIGSNRKVWWLGKKCGHSWESTVQSRSRGRGCRICKYRQNGIKKSKSVLSKDNNLLSANPLAANMWHPTLNQTSPDKVSPNSNKKAWWLCATCKHFWKATIANIHRRNNNGNGCPACHGLIMTENNSLQTKRPDLARQWHPDNKLRPYEVVCNSKYQALWMCHQDASHQWRATVNSRNFGTGCPRCKNKTQNLLFNIVSKIFNAYEIKYDDKNSGLKFKNGKKMQLDIFIPDLKLAFEYQGEQHFGLRRDLLPGLKSQLERDEEKRIGCINAKIRLIEIDYTWDRSEKQIIDLLTELKIIAG